MDRPTDPRPLEPAPLGRLFSVLDAGHPALLPENSPLGGPVIDADRIPPAEASTRAWLHRCSLYSMPRDTAVRFRAEAELVDAVDRAAEAAGVSRSAAIRAALAEVLDVEEPTAA